MAKRWLAQIAGLLSMFITAGTLVAVGPQQQPGGGLSPSVSPPRGLLDQYCVSCHNDKLKTAGLALDTMDPEDQPRLLHILIDPESPFDGEATKELRRVTTADGLHFFELRLPINLARTAANLTTDNIFDLLAGFRSEDADLTSYTREFPLAATADYYDFLDLILRNDLTESEATRLHARSRNYAQFVRLLSGLERAEALDTRLLID